MFPRLHARPYPPEFISSPLCTCVVLSPCVAAVLLPTACSLCSCCCVCIIMFGGYPLLGYAAESYRCMYPTRVRGVCVPAVLVSSHLQLAAAIFNMHATEIQPLLLPRGSGPTTLFALGTSRAAVRSAHPLRGSVVACFSRSSTLTPG